MNIEKEIEKNIKIHQDFIDQAKQFLQRNPDLDPEEFYDEYRNRSSFLHLNPIFLNVYIKCNFSNLKPSDYDDINYRCIYQDYFQNRTKITKEPNFFNLDLTEISKTYGYTFIKNCRITNKDKLDNDLKNYYEDILDFYDSHPELERLDMSELSCVNCSKFIREFFMEMKGVDIIFWDDCDYFIKNIYKIINLN